MDSALGGGDGGVEHVYFVATVLGVFFFSRFGERRCEKKGNWNVDETWMDWLVGWFVG